MLPSRQLHRSALCAPSNDPSRPPSSEVTGKAAALLHHPSPSSPDKGCLGEQVLGRGPGQGWLVGSSEAGSHSRDLEKRESRGEGAELPHHHLSSLLPAFAPLSPNSKPGKPQHNSLTIPLPDNLQMQHLPDTGDAVLNISFNVLYFTTSLVVLWLFVCLFF